ncbi:MAG: roadblock/LC7 domain-containing protein [Chitinispirillaceae bacterium]|nr:roadblock/LC7 domain-containing protein [Chitinispirillaceae bacterium]
MTNKSDKIKEVLNRYRSVSPDIFGASVITMDGFMVASVTLSEIDEGLVGGITAALLGVGERIAKEMMNSKMTQIFVKSESGYIICNNISDETVLVSLVNSDAKLGLIFLEIKRILPELGKII